MIGGVFWPWVRSRVSRRAHSKQVAAEKARRVADDLLRKERHAEAWANARRLHAAGFKTCRSIGFGDLKVPPQLFHKPGESCFSSVLQCQGAVSLQDALALLEDQASARRRADADLLIWNGWAPVPDTGGVMWRPPWPDAPTASLEDAIKWFHSIKRAAVGARDAERKAAGTFVHMRAHWLKKESRASGEALQCGHIDEVFILANEIKAGEHAKRGAHQ